MLLDCVACRREAAAAASGRCVERNFAFNVSEWVDAWTDDHGARFLSANKETGSTFLIVPDRSDPFGADSSLDKHSMNEESDDTLEDDRRQQTTALWSFQHFSTVGRPPDEEEEVVEGEEEELEEHMNTAMQSFLHLLKGYIGPGCLSLPWAVSQIGIRNGVLACFILGSWTAYNSWSLVQLKRRLPDDVNTYPEVAGSLSGKTLHRVTFSCVSITQIGICTVFLSFVATNIQAFLQPLLDLTYKQTLSFVILPIVLGLMSLPDLKALVKLSLLGTILLVQALLLLAFVMVQAAQGNMPDVPDPPLDESFLRYPLALCAILYTFEGINLVLPIENTTRSTDFVPTFWTVMLLTPCVFALVSGGSVASFGSIGSGSLTAYLLDAVYVDPSRERSLIEFANMSVTLSVLVTYPLQLYPAMEVMGPWLESFRQRIGFRAIAASETDYSNADDEEVDALVQPDSPGWTTRLSLLLGTYLVALSVPNVESLISLAGAIAGSTTALIIPPILELNTNQRGLAAARSYLLIALGVFFGGIGTIAALQNILNL